MGHVDQTGLLDDAAALSAELGGQRGQHIHRVELRLVVQQRRPELGKGHRQVIDPAHRQPERGRCLVLGLRLPAAGPHVRGVRARRPVLDRDAVLRAERQQPGLTLPVGLDVGLHHPPRLALEQGRIGRPLQQ